MMSELHIQEHLWLGKECICLSGGDGWMSICTDLLWIWVLKISLNVRIENKSFLSFMHPASSTQKEKYSFFSFVQLWICYYFCVQSSSLCSHTHNWSVSFYSLMLYFVQILVQKRYTTIVQPSLVNTDVCSDNYNITMAINITWVWTRLASANHCQHSEAKYIFTQLLDIFRSMIQMFFCNNNSLNISNYFQLKFQTLYMMIYCVLELNKDK